jgi:phytoene dehydrogenase-like protein
MFGEYDALVVGSGPNGLAAAVYLQQKGLKTIIFEHSDTIGGGAKTLELTLPGYKHDIASAIHPLAFDSPYLKTLPLEQFGLHWIHPDIPFAHPFEDGDAHACFQSIEQTAQQLGVDSRRYTDLMAGFIADWQDIAQDVLGPLSFTRHPVKLARFGLKALMSAKGFANKHFKEEKSRAFFYGAAAHSTLPLDKTATASFGIVLHMLAHIKGWPFPEGGAGNIAKALAAYYHHLGGMIITGHTVKDLAKLPPATTYLFDLTPRQLIKIKGLNFTKSYRDRMAKYKYGAGVFKIDYALSEPIPFTNPKVSNAGTVHLGFSTKEIELSEKLIHNNLIYERPYVLLCQHSVFDRTRTPDQGHTGWAYCHVAHGSSVDMTEFIENQIEKAAPGFRDVIVKRVTHSSPQMQVLNPNLIGGDINGGMQNLGQMFTRPLARLSPYSTPDPKAYICSSSTPPGGGVHGMCGYWAARKVWKDHFRK